MAYGVVIDVPAPIEMYDAVHAEVARRVGTSVDGLLVHLGRPTSAGFQVVEVWESRWHFDRYNRDLIRPIMAKLSDGRSRFSGKQVVDEFEVRGLVIPQGNIFR